MFYEINASNTAQVDRLEWDKRGRKWQAHITYRHAGRKRTRIFNVFTLTEAYPESYKGVSVELDVASLFKSLPPRPADLDLYAERRFLDNWGEKYYGRELRQHLQDGVKAGQDPKPAKRKEETPAEREARIVAEKREAWTKKLQRDRRGFADLEASGPDTLPVLQTVLRDSVAKVEALLAGLPQEEDLVIY